MELYSRQSGFCGTEQFFLRKTPSMTNQLNYETIPPTRRHVAADALYQGAVGLLLNCCYQPQLWLRFVGNNLPQLKQGGIFESCLLRAFTHPRTPFTEWPTSSLRLLFDAADRSELRRAGDPIPEPAAFGIIVRDWESLRIRLRDRHGMPSNATVRETTAIKIYRGVSGYGKFRRPRGFAWTAKLDVACFYALRYSLPVPAIFEATITPNEIQAFVHGSFREDTIICQPAQAMQLDIRTEGIEREVGLYYSRCRCLTRPAVKQKKTSERALALESDVLSPAVVADASSISLTTDSPCQGHKGR